MSILVLTCSSYALPILKKSAFFTLALDSKKSVLKTMAAMDLDKINMDLVECLLEWIVDGKHDYPPGSNAAVCSGVSVVVRVTISHCFIVSDAGAVLVFLPGLAEIKMLYEQLMSNRLFNNRGKSRSVSRHMSLAVLTWCWLLQII